MSHPIEVRPFEVGERIVAVRNTNRAPRGATGIVNKAVGDKSLQLYHSHRNLIAVIWDHDTAYENNEPGVSYALDHDSVRREVPDLDNLPAVEAWLDE